MCSYSHLRIFFQVRRRKFEEKNTELVLLGIKLWRITNFLVTILTGKRLIPFRTQKLSPLRPMVVLAGESRLLPGIIKADTERCRPFPMVCPAGHTYLEVKVLYGPDSGQNLRGNFRG